MIIDCVGYEASEQGHGHAHHDAGYFKSVPNPDPSCVLNSCIMVTKDCRYDVYITSRSDVIRHRAHNTLHQHVISSHFIMSSLLIISFHVIISSHLIPLYLIVISLDSIVSSHLISFRRFISYISSHLSLVL